MAKYKEVMIITKEEYDRQIFADAVKIVSPKSHTIGINGADCGIQFLTDPNELLPDIIFLDRTLRGMNSKDCLKKIRSLSYLNHVPIIMYSTSELAFHQIEPLIKESPLPANEQIPLVLLYINMLKLNGFELREKLRTDADLGIKCIPYLFFATAIEQKAVINAYNLSAPGFFIKQTEMPKLEKIISITMEYWKNCATSNHYN